MKFNKKLRLIRKKEGLTQKELARILNSSEISIRLYEIEKRSPNGKFLQKLSNRFPEYALWLMTDSVDVEQINNKILTKEE